MLIRWALRSPREGRPRTDDGHGLQFSPHYLLMHSGREPLNHRRTPWDRLQRRRFAHWTALAMITALTGVTAANAQSQTLLTTQTPAAQDVSDGVSYELGERVASDAAGPINGLPCL